MPNVPHEGPEGAQDDLTSDDGSPGEHQRTTIIPGEVDDGRPSTAATPTELPAHPELADIRQDLGAEHLQKATLAELLFYALSDGGEGPEAVLRAARDDLGNLANLTIGSAAGTADLVSLRALGGSLEGVVRRLDVVIALMERAPRPSAVGQRS